MTDAPRISVVIPARDRAWALPACLDSVLAQTLPPMEVLVVDDHSQDATAEVVRGYAGRGVRLVTLADGAGAQAARNLGLREARGDWIAFQDSDDLWLPDKLAAQAPHCAPTLDVVVHGDALVRADGRDRRLRVPRTEGDATVALLQRQGPLFPALVVPRARLLEAGGLDETCTAYQEWDTALRLAGRCRFVHLRRPLFVWVRHNRDSISKAPARGAASYLRLATRWRAAIEAQLGARGWRRHCVAAAVLAMRAGQWDEARAIVAAEPAHPALQAAAVLARLRLVPPMAGRVLRMMA